MKIAGIDMEWQTKKNNSGIIMTWPIWQDLPDQIIDYGCLLIAKLNCYNLVNKSHKAVSWLNDLMIQKKGYMYLDAMQRYNNDADIAKKHCYQRESFQIQSVINGILGIYEDERNYTGDIDISSPSYYYLVKTKYRETGHWSMIISSSKKYLDSYDGMIKEPREKDILEIRRLGFGGLA